MKRSRTGQWGAALTAVGLLAGLAAAPPATGPDTGADTVAVVVQGADSQQAAEAVTTRGGTVDRPLDVVGGVAARLSPEEVAALRTDSTVRVAADIPLEFNSADLAVAEPVGGEQLQAINPGETWSPETGSGVGVALIDTGVVETPELAGRVIHGPDYSDEGDGVDRYGHGTFMAGLIAGNGDNGTGEYYGVAPGAHIVSLKLAGRDGETSLSKVLDAIGWVVVNQDEYGIRVMNLSVGVPLKMAPQADPLAAAVEAAWASGITVVAAVGNDGEGTVTAPGRDPYVITVGSTDTNGTVDTADDTVPAWSGSGKVTNYTKPELLAPGASVVSLRASGSLVDEENPAARIGDGNFRGSGTSMSAAVVSGAVAALAEFRPYATPDDLKGALVSTGAPVAGTNARAIDLAAADAAPADPAWRQQHKVAFKDLDGHLKRGMPWSQESSPSVDETWARMGWSDGEWTRMGWSRMGWSDESFARMGWSRMGWSEANFARMGWSDANFTRMGWSRMGWSRMGWSRMGWSRMGWSAQDWTVAESSVDWSVAGWDR